MPSSWKTSLKHLLHHLRANPRIVVVGIGNTLRSDDSAGILIARALMQSGSLKGLETVHVMDAGHAPENCAAELRRFAPAIVLLIDAAELYDVPGTIHWIEMDELDGMSASTHSMPLSMLAAYLTLELNCNMALLGIQPKSNDVGEIISREVSEAAKIIVEELVESLS